MWWCPTYRGSDPISDVLTAVGICLFVCFRAAEVALWPPDVRQLAESCGTVRLACATGTGTGPKTAKMYLWVRDLLLAVNAPKIIFAADPGWSADTWSDLIFFKTETHPEVYLTRWRGWAR